MVGSAVAAQFEKRRAPPIAWGRDGRVAFFWILYFWRSQVSRLRDGPRSNHAFGRKDHRYANTHATQNHMFTTSPSQFTTLQYRNKYISYTGINTNWIRAMEHNDPRRRELADFLKAMRERCLPQQFGFAEGRRRRTPGLRREEAAQLASISPTWYTWIEQAREVSVSADVLDRLAIALRMDRSQRAYLFEVAGRHDPHALTAIADELPPSLSQLLAQLSSPAYILGRNWDVLAYNPAAQELFQGWLGTDPQPNLIRYVFTEAQARQVVVDWETRARRLVAEFRTDCRARLDDPQLNSFIDELSSASPDFARFWKQHDVLERQGGLRVFAHPQRGEWRLQQLTLRSVEQEHLKLVVLIEEVGDVALGADLKSAL